MSKWNNITKPKDLEDKWWEAVNTVYRFTPYHIFNALQPDPDRITATFVIVTSPLFTTDRMMYQNHPHLYHLPLAVPRSPDLGSPMNSFPGRSNLV